MALKYVYMIFSHHIAYTPILLWAGTQKHAATSYLAKELENGVSMSEFQIVRMKDGQPHTQTDIDVYEFLEIDQGETE